jgi:hypothetical protein
MLREHAEDLLQEFNMCCKAKPKHNAIGIQLEKDSVGKWASHLSYQLSWGDDNEIAEACHQLESRIKPLKEKLIFEVLKHGI